jgi:17beta-estradiol 17-dehydrogenase / very-long-chain 3-oxoacyl-CoA reductase
LLNLTIHPRYLGSTSGIGKGFAEYLAKMGMSMLIISRSESKLKEQQKELEETYKVPVRCITYDFTQPGEARSQFYEKLHRELTDMDVHGGISLLINNVGIANEFPKTVEEFSDQEIDDMIQCNCYSTVMMTRAVFKYMKAKKTGSIVSISSGSANFPAPYLAVYSATK